MIDWLIDAVAQLFLYLLVFVSILWVIFYEVGSWFFKKPRRR